jgi:hypothetical protein
MISTKFYSQISVCNACKGWGTEKIPADNYKKLCPECSGEGLAIFRSDNTFLWDAPFFIDYRSRVRIKIAKLFLAATVLILVIGMVFIMFAFFNSIFRF